MVYLIADDAVIDPIIFRVVLGVEGLVFCGLHFRHIKTSIDLFILLAESDLKELLEHFGKVLKSPFFYD